MAKNSNSSEASNQENSPVDLNEIKLQGTIGSTTEPPSEPGPKPPRIKPQRTDSTTNPKSERGPKPTRIKKTQVNAESVTETESNQIFEAPEMIEFRGITESTTTPKSERGRKPER